MSIGFQTVGQYEYERQNILNLKNIKNASLIPDYMKSAHVLFPDVNLIPVEIRGSVSSALNFGWKLHGRLTFSSTMSMGSIRVVNGLTTAQTVYLSTVTQSGAEGEPLRIGGLVHQFDGTFERIEATTGFFHFIGYAVVKTTGTPYPGLPGSTSTKDLLQVHINTTNYLNNTQKIDLYKNGNFVKSAIREPSTNIWSFDANDLGGTYKVGDTLQLRFINFEGNKLDLLYNSGTDVNITSTSLELNSSVENVDITAAFEMGTEIIRGTISTNDYDYLNARYSFITKNQYDTFPVPEIEIAYGNNGIIEYQGSIFIHDNQQTFLNIKNWSKLTSFAVIGNKDVIPEKTVYQFFVHYNEYEARNNLNLLLMWEWGSGPSYSKSQDLKSIFDIGKNVTIRVEKLITV